jgi:nucleoside-diphosphate-sugar epimerase
MKKILVTGGYGYVGAKLVPALVNAGYSVNILDWCIYKKNLFNNFSKSLVKTVVGDLRNPKDVEKALDGCDVVIHLACISNDPSAELNQEFTKDVNQNGFKVLLDACKKIKLERFIFASSSSIYGISDAEHVYEDHPRVPVSLYNISKAWCEDVLKEKYTDIPYVIVRPATICGFSNRIRLDLAVNLLTANAIKKGAISIFGGDQFRPNLHIDDMVDLYLYMLEKNLSDVLHETFNASYGNKTINEIGNSIVTALNDKIDKIDVNYVESNDPRSYRVNCSKLFNLGFKTNYVIEDAVSDIYHAFINGDIPGNIDDEIYVNTKMMKKIGLI